MVYIVYVYVHVRKCYLDVERNSFKPARVVRYRRIVHSSCGASDKRWELVANAVGLVQPLSTPHRLPTSG
jgi:hypothetical protein